MDPRDLLKALMARDGLNPTSLSKAVNGRTKQPQIHRFVTGQALEPKRSTLQPVADHFKIPVDALFDPREASRVAQQLGIGSDAGALRVMQTGHPPQSTPDLAAALPVVLGRLPGLDTYRAEQVLHAVQSATQPGADLERIERDLLQWLTEPRQAGPQAEPGKRTGTR